MVADDLAAVAALGNPGVEYLMTRHNVGFWVVDALSARSGVDFRFERKFQGEVARLSLANRPVPVLKPMTFMNESGRAVQAFCAYHKFTPEQLLVIHDDLDLPVGTVRLKRGGGHGGHNGLRDIIAYIGAGFMRMRIGIGRPPAGMDAVHYVLSRPATGEEPTLLESVETAIRVLSLLKEEGLEAAMRILHSPRKDPDPTDAVDSKPSRQDHTQ